MKRIKNESNLRNWFKKNYRELGFSKILYSYTKKFPDFIMLENGKKVKVELETKSSNFILHNHPKGKNIRLVCIINDANPKVRTLVIKGMRLISFNEKESPYSLKKELYRLIKKKKVVTSSEVAKFLKVSWNTADSYLKELLIIGKVERIKKEGVTLWLKK